MRHDHLEGYPVSHVSCSPESKLIVEDLTCKTKGKDGCGGNSKATPNGIVYCYCGGTGGPLGRNA